MSDRILKMADLLEQLARWPSDTSLNDRNEVRLVGHQPHRAKLAYLHTLYPSLGEQDVATLEAVIQRKLPPTLKRFYAATNGIRLFESLINVSGLTVALNRDSANPQPICLETENLAFPSRYPDWNRQGYFIIGALALSQQNKLICGPNDQIVLLDSVSGEPQREFHDVFHCLVSLTRELAAFWNDDGCFAGDWEVIDQLVVQRTGSA